MQGGLGRFPFRGLQGVCRPPKRLWHCFRGRFWAPKTSRTLQGLGAGASRGLGLQGPPGPPGAGASRGLQGVPSTGPPGACRGLRGRGLQGPGPPGASRSFQILGGYQPFWPDFGRFPAGPPASRPPPADLLQLGARTLQGGPPRRSLKMWVCQVEALILGFRVFPSRGKSMYIVYIWPTGVAGGRAVPPDVREEPGGALYVHSP